MRLDDLEKSTPDPGPNNTPVVTVLLWEVAEDPSVRNRPPVRVPLGTDWLIRPADLGLALRYVLTAWAPPAPDRLATEQKLLGRVVEFFYRHAILAGPELAGELAGTNSALAVTMAALSLDDRTRLWGLLAPKYRLSLFYDVRVVDMPFADSTTVKAVQERRIEAVMPGSWK